MGEVERTARRESEEAVNILDLAPGLHRSIAESVYHQRVAGLASKSALDLVDDCPALYKAWLDGASDEDTPALFFGRAFHCAALEPERFRADYIVKRDFPDGRTKEGKAAKAVWEETSRGRIALDADDAVAIAGMVDALRAHSTIGPLLDQSTEITVRWTDPATGLPCKARADIHDEDFDLGFDLKSATDASREGFRRQAENFAYHNQEAHYRNGFRVVGRPLKEFRFITVRKRAPHLVAMYMLDEDALRRGTANIERLMALLAECIESDTFPGYPEDSQTVSLRPWVR